MADIITATLKELVIDDFRMAAVFERHSLDFCCRGGKTVEEACREKDVDPQQVFADLNGLAGPGAGANEQYASLSAAELIQLIVEKHHAYVRTMVPVLLAHSRKVATVHGANHPEVIEIAEKFEEVAADLQQHMMKEEHILFPYIFSIGNALDRGERAVPPPFGTARNPIRMMEAEHQAAGDELYAIRALSSNYAPPPDACTTYRITYQELQDFEQDLHRHVHLENNILFPMALALEEKLFTAA
ncbi:MAG: iron-sulfur cluster repair di-iron protein [Bacteroidota bacterium]